MFKLSKKPEFTHDVAVNVPVDGGHEEQSVKARYRVISDDEAATFDAGTTEGLTKFLKRVVVRIDDVVDDAGKPITWSEELFEQLLGLAYVRLGLWQGYLKGIVGAHLGN